jgi:hypothetical protein
MGIIEIDAGDRILTPTQRAFVDDRTRFKLLSGGVGAGKSSTGADAFFPALLRNRPANGLIIGPTWEMVNGLMLPEWERVCPPELIAGYDPDKDAFILTTGQLVYCRSAWAPRSSDGFSVGTFWLDEARYCARVTWRNLVGRLRDKRALNPQGIVTSTPSMGWLEAEFNRGILHRKPFEISTRENAVNLAPGYIENIELSYSKRMCEAMVEGKFTPLEGPVYGAFDPKKHVLNWRHDWRFRTTAFIDFGIRRSSVLIAQETDAYPVPVTGLESGQTTIPPQSIVIIDELQPDNCATDWLPGGIGRLMKQREIPHLNNIYCDPAGGNRSEQVGYTDVDILKEAFGNIVDYQNRPEYRWIPNGVMAVERLLAPIQGPPRLYFDRRLLDDKRELEGNDFHRGIIPMLRCYTYPDAKEGRSGSDHPKNDDYYKHVSDALRYGVINTLLLSFRQGLGHQRLIATRG